MAVALRHEDSSKNMPPNPSGIGRPRLRVQAASRRQVQQNTRRDARLTRRRGRLRYFVHGPVSVPEATESELLFPIDIPNLL
jgi:hypothetical protein